MPARRDVFSRPLLGITRMQTRGYCAALGLPVWNDPSNDDPALTRNRVRATVLPTLEAQLGPGIAAALARTADLLRDDADALDAAAAAAYDGLAVVTGSTVELPIAGLVELPAAVRRRVIHRAAITAGAPAGAVGSVHLLAAEALITGWRGQGPVSLPGGFAVTRRYATLHVAPGPSLLE
jgi:tRNA(Ile)-lysidine synthase